MSESTPSTSSNLTKCLTYLGFGFISGVVATKLFSAFKHSKKSTPILFNGAPGDATIDWMKVNDPKIRKYIHKSNREIKEFDLINDKTISLFPKVSDMVCDLSQMYFFHFLIKLLNVKNAIEVGTFTGSSSLAIAKALPKDGKLICIDPSKEFTDVAKEFWKRANIMDRIDLRLKPGVSELELLCNNKSNLNKFDFIFLDALKTEYTQYYELCLKLIKPKTGIICFDNTLWSLRVIDPNRTDETTSAIRQFNKYVQMDPRVEMVLTDIGDGTTFVRKM